MSAYSYLFKYIVIGESNVGKSCLLLQFIDKRYKAQHDPTIGVEFGTKNLSIQNTTIKLQVWDTAGQESFRSITRAYYRGSIVALLVYDITKRDTFENLGKWIDDAKTFSNEQTIIVLIGNKCDLAEQREIPTEEGQKFAKDNGMLFMETSARTGFNVENAFRTAAENIYEKIESGKIDPTQDSCGIKLGPLAQMNQSSETTQGKSVKKRGCC